MPFSDCSGNFTVLTAAQMCVGFSKCGPDGIRMNSTGFNSVVRALEAQIAASAADKFLIGLNSYNPVSNIMTLNMSDGSTVDIDMTALIADAMVANPQPNDTTSLTAASSPAIRGLSLGNVNKPIAAPAAVADFTAPNAADLEVSYASMVKLFTNSTSPANVDAFALNHNAGVMNQDGTIGHYARWFDYANTATAIGSQESNGTAHRLGTGIPSGSTMTLAPARYAGELRYIYAFPNVVQPLDFINIQAQGPGGSAGFLYGPLRTSFGGDIYQKEGVSTMVLRRGEGVLLVARAGNQWNVVATAYSTLRGANYAETAPGIIQAWGATPINVGTLPPLASSTVINGTNGNSILMGQLA